MTASGGGGDGASSSAPKRRRRPEPTPVQRALGLLTRREHSRDELVRKLKQRGVEADDAAAAVDRLAEAGIISSVFIDAEIDQIDAAARIGARVCEIHTGPYAHAFHHQGRDAESPAVLAELEKIRMAGEAIRRHGMRFNAGHALNYFNVQPVARLPGIRELHIGHAIVSRAVFVGMRTAVSEMKRLMREAQAFAQ